MEIQVTRLMIYLIRKGYGCDCKTSDLDDFSEEYITAKSVFAKDRCASCRAKEIIDWLEEHIKLVKWSNE